MDLALSDEQQALVSSFADLLAKHASTERVRAAEPSGFDPSLWEALLGIGVVEMAVPEAGGGWGAGLLDLALVAEQVGAAVGAGAGDRGAGRGPPARGPDGPGSRRPRRRAEGERIVTLAVRPAAGPRATLVPAGGGRRRRGGARAATGCCSCRSTGARRPVANLAAAPLADVTLGERAGTTELASGSAADRGLRGGARRVARPHRRRARRHGVVGPPGDLRVRPRAPHLGRADRRRTRPSPTRWPNGATAIDGARLLAGKAAWELQAGGPRGP